MYTYNIYVYMYIYMYICICIYIIVSVYSVDTPEQVLQVLQEINVYSKVNIYVLFIFPPIYLFKKNNK